MKKSFLLTFNLSNNDKQKTHYTRFYIYKNGFGFDVSHSQFLNSLLQFINFTSIAQLTDDE